MKLLAPNTYDLVLLLQWKQLDYQLPELGFICLNALFTLERLIYWLVGSSNELAPTLNQRPKGIGI